MTYYTNSVETQFEEISAVIKGAKHAFDFYEILTVLNEHYFLVFRMNDEERKQMFSNLIDLANTTAANKGITDEEIARQVTFV